MSHHVCWEEDQEMNGKYFGLAVSAENWEPSKLSSEAPE